MRNLILVSIAIFGVAVMAGCSGDSDSSEKQLQGKPEIKEMPPGTKAPGDERNPAQSDGSRDGD